MSAASQRWTVARLGTAQTLAWASSYYLPAMLAAPMARDLGVTTPTVFAAFSVALIVSALLGPFAGRGIDRHGGRPVLLDHRAAPFLLRRRAVVERVEVTSALSFFVHRDRCSHVAAFEAGCGFGAHERDHVCSADIEVRRSIAELFQIEADFLK